MYKFLSPLFNLATAHVRTWSRFFLDPKPIAAWRARNLALWQATVNDHAQFTSDCTQGWVNLLSYQRTLLDGHLEQLSDRAERVASELARTTERAVGIATHARRGQLDRRIFSVALPIDRRAGPRGDRRSAKLPLAAPAETRQPAS